MLELRVPLGSTNHRSTIAVGIICGIGASLFWAAGFAGTRHGLDVGFTPADLTIHRYIWSGFLLLPFVMLTGFGNLNSIGWARGILLAVLGGPCFAIISYAGFQLVPLGHGGVIQPSCATLGGVLLAKIVLGENLAIERLAGALIIVCGLFVIGAEAATSMGVHGIIGDLMFVLAGLMFAAFGTLLRLWGTRAMAAAVMISILSLLIVPVYWSFGGFAHLSTLGWRENLTQAVLQGVLAGPAALYLFARSVSLLGAGRAAIFSSLVPPFVLLLGWLALGDVPTAFQLGGLIIALIGFRLAQKG